MNIANYAQGLTNQIFKALPMRQAGDMEVSCLMQHMHSLFIDSTGYLIAHPELSEDRDFQTVVDIVAFLGTTEVDDKTWKREILKATNLLNKIELKYGGDEDG